MTQVDNRRIAKNTLYMYLRMLVTMVVSLYTTRIVFRALGVDNFGIYNIVGSVIVFFTFINSGLTNKLQNLPKAMQKASVMYLALRFGLIF